MADRHKGQWRPTLRPDRATYDSVLAKLQAEGRTMNEEFDGWLRWMDGQADEHPPRPDPADASVEAAPEQPAG